MYGKSVTRTFLGAHTVQTVPKYIGCCTKEPDSFYCGWMLDVFIFDPHSRTEIIPVIFYFCFLFQVHDMILAIASVLHL